MVPKELNLTEETTKSRYSISFDSADTNGIQSVSGSVNHINFTHNENNIFFSF